VQHSNYEDISSQYSIFDRFSDIHRKKLWIQLDPLVEDLVDDTLWEAGGQADRLLDDGWE
jgi:hypothetical protein